MKVKLLVMLGLSAFSVAWGAQSVGQTVNNISFTICQYNPDGQTNSDINSLLALKKPIFFFLTATN